MRKTTAEIEKFIQDMEVISKQLWAFIAGSFVVSILSAIASYEQVGLSFSAIITLVGGTMGIAGVLSAFLGSYVHPADTYEILDYRPILAGLGIFLSTILSVVCFYLYYYFCQSSNHFCLLFIAIGMFLFFRMLGSFVLTIRRIEFQKTIWNQMTSEMHAAFYERQEKSRIAIENLKDIRATISESKDLAKSAQDSWKESRRNVRRVYWKGKLARLKTAWLKFRRNIGGKRLLTSSEKLESSLLEEEFKMTIGLNNPISEVLSGKYGVPSKLEGTSIRIYDNGVWLFAVIDEDVSEALAKSYLDKLSNCCKHKRKVYGIIADSAKITFDAKQLFEEAGIEFLKDNSPAESE